MDADVEMNFTPVPNETRFQPRGKPSPVLAPGLNIAIPAKAGTHSPVAANFPGNRTPYNDDRLVRPNDGPRPFAGEAIRGDLSQILNDCEPTSQERGRRLRARSKRYQIARARRMARTPITRNGEIRLCDVCDSPPTRIITRAS